MNNNDTFYFSQLTNDKNHGYIVFKNINPLTDFKYITNYIPSLVNNKFFGNLNNNQSIQIKSLPNKGYLTLIFLYYTLSKNQADIFNVISSSNTNISFKYNDINKFTFANNIIDLNNQFVNFKLYVIILQIDLSSGNTILNINNIEYRYNFIFKLNSDDIIEFTTNNLNMFGSISVNLTNDNTFYNTIKNKYNYLISIIPKSTQAESTPAESTQAESTPAESTPAESTQAESTQAESTQAEETTEAEEIAAAAPEQAPVQETSLAPATTTTQAAPATEPNNFRGLIKGPHESFINQSNNQGLMKFIDKYKYEIDNNINILIHSCTIYIDKDFENNNIFSSTTNISDDNQLFITKSSDELTIRVSRVLPNINRKTITIDNLTYELQFKNTTEYTTIYIINNIKNMVDILKNTNNIENVDILFIIDTYSLPLNNNSNILNIKSAISNGKVIHIIWNFDSFKKIIIYMKEFFAENTDELDKLTEQEQKQIGTNAKQILIDNDILIDISHDINIYDKFTVDGIDYLSAEIHYNINSVQYNTQPPTTTTQESTTTTQAYEPQTVIPIVVEILDLSKTSMSSNSDQFTNINNPMRYSNNNLSYNVNKYNYDSTSASLFDKLFK